MKLAVIPIVFGARETFLTVIEKDLLEELKVGKEKHY